jgi:hypothetical protein
MMCRRRAYHRAFPSLSSGGAYEGKTVQLDAGAGAEWEDQERRKACSGFPWWTLWLIWPLILAVKAFGAALASIGAGVIATIGAPANLLAAVVAVLLIVVGLMLIRR